MIDWFVYSLPEQGLSHITIQSCRSTVGMHSVMGRVTVLNKCVESCAEDKL